MYGILAYFLELWYNRSCRIYIINRRVGRSSVCVEYWVVCYDCA